MRTFRLPLLSKPFFHKSSAHSSTATLQHSRCEYRTSTALQRALQEIEWSLLPYCSSALHYCSSLVHTFVSPSLKRGLQTTTFWTTFALEDPAECQVHSALSLRTLASIVSDLASFAVAVCECASISLQMPRWDLQGRLWFQVLL